MQLSHLSLTLLSMLAYTCAESAASASSHDESQAPSPADAEHKGFGDLFGGEDGKMPNLEEMKEQFKKILGEDFDFDKLFGDMNEQDLHDETDLSQDDDVNDL